MQRTFHGINVQIIRSMRRTISIELKPSGIVVRAPKRVTDAEAMDFVERKGSWIDKHWKQIQERQKQAQALEPFTQAEIRELNQTILRITGEFATKTASLVDKILSLMSK